MPGFPMIWRRSLCAASGAMAGGIAGFAFGLAQTATGPLPLNAAIKAGVILGIVGWLALLVVVGVWLRYGMRAIALQTFVTALLSAVLTTMIANIVTWGTLDVWIGLLVGTLVGALLCRFCKQLEVQRAV